jgi:glycosyltransferase involved in cell wall biosynthesis
MRPVLSVIVPMFNEQPVVALLVGRLRPVLEDLADAYEVVFVDDGSTDLTPALLERTRREWPEVRVVRLRANAGHQAAISAGLCRALGDYVITLDADLQDPPEVVTAMLEVARRTGVDVVYGVRTDRSSDSWFKRHSAAVFYRLVGKLSAAAPPSQAGDFRLMSRAAVDAVVALPEHNRVLRFVVPALGFPSETVGYVRAPRAAGTSKYPLTKMLSLSLDAFAGSSIAPLRFATMLGLGGAVMSLAFGVYVLVSLLLGSTVAGWASTVLIVSSVGAVQLLCLGVLGEYVGRTFTQLQGRPAYYVASDSLVGRSEPLTDADPRLVGDVHAVADSRHFGA